MMMIACAVVGASAGCYQEYGPYLVEESGESEEVVPPCSEADAGAEDAGADAAEDAPTDAPAD